MLRKITDCKSLKIYQKKLHDRVLSVKLQTYSGVKRTHGLFLEYVSKTICSKKYILRKRYMVD